MQVRIVHDFAVGERLEYLPTLSYFILYTKNRLIKYMSIGEKRATKPTPYAARRARKSSQYISCATEVVKDLHFRYMSAQRGDCIYKLPVFAACFFFIHTFLFRISKVWMERWMAAGLPVSKTQMKQHYGVPLEVAKSYQLQIDERPPGGVYI